MRKSRKIILGVMAGVVAVVGAGVLINYFQERDYLYDDDLEDEFEDYFDDGFEDEPDDVIGN